MDKGDDPQVRRVFFSILCDYTAALLEKGLQEFGSIFSSLGSVAWLLLIVGNEILLRGFDCG